MKSIFGAMRFIANLLIIGVVVNAGVWLIAKGINLVFKGFGRLNRNV